MLHRLVRIAGAVLRNVFAGVLRTVVTFLVFGLCAMVTMRYFGLPVPSPLEVLHYVEGLSKLAKILS